MVHTTNVAASAAAAAATTASRPNLSTTRRLRTSGSFHAGEPFPQLSALDESLPSSSRRRTSSAADRRAPLRRQSTAKYHTFPTPPPATPSERQASPQILRPWHKRLFQTRNEVSDIGGEGGSDDAHDTQDRGARRRGNRATSDSDGQSASTHESPLPWMQLGLLALLSLAEQTALNSIGPYLPAMVASFEEIPNGQEGLYVGLLASAFALAQLTTNLFWGYLSDRIGRKPVMLLGTSLLMVCFVCFGFCTTYAQLVMVHVAMGLLNGNAAIVPTCLGEVTDRSNQSKAFTWLPVIYSLGSITGPALGGLLVGVAGGPKYPFLAPNVFDAAFLLASVVVLAVWFEETLSGVDQKAAAAGMDWVGKTRDWFTARWGGLKGRSTGKGRRLSGRIGSNQDGGRADLSASSSDGSMESGVSDDDGDYDDNEHQGLLGSHKLPEDEENDGMEDPQEQESAFHHLVNRNTVSLLGTYLVFQLANISFNSLYPIFASAPPPTGRELGPGTIGLSLSFAGVVTILFQLFLFQKLKARVGNLGTYRYSLLGMAISMALMPWIGHLDGKPLFGSGTGRFWLYAELGMVLVLKNICAVGGLSSVMLLVRPSHEIMTHLHLSYHDLDVTISNQALDYQLCRFTRDSWHTQWNCTDPLGRWP